MLKKADRLSTREFAAVIASGREAYSPFFSIRSVPSASFKLAATAPKKIWKTATARNSVRRRIYGAIEKIVSRKKPRSSSVIVIAKKSIDDSSTTIASSPHFADLFVKARLLA